MTPLAAEPWVKKRQEFELIMATSSKTRYNAGITPLKFRAVEEVSNPPCL
jgi:hypothetical protein